MAWTVEVMSIPALAGAGIVQPESISITRRLSSWCTLEGKISAGALGADLITVGTGIRVWWVDDSTPGAVGVKRFAGRVVSTDAESSGGANPTISFVAHDCFEQLFRQHMWEYPYINFTSDTVNAISTLLTAAAAYHFLYVTIDTTQPNYGTPYTCMIEPGPTWGDIITQVATADSGAWFTIDPVTNPLYNGWISTIALRGGVSDGSGVRRPEARFEHGSGTIGNLEKVRVATVRPVNRAIVTDDTGANQMIEDIPSALSYGVNDTWLNEGTPAASAQSAGQAMITAEPVKTVDASVSPYGGGLPSPRPWVDFDVGDYVRILVVSASPQLAYDDYGRVVEFTLSVDANGVERVTNIGFEQGE